VNKRLALLLVSLLALSLFTAAPVRAIGMFITRVQMFKPDGTGGWTPLDCSSGTASVSGVGNVRMLGYVTWTGPNPQYTTRFTAAYGFGNDGSKDWYTTVSPTVPSNREILAVDMVQDLTKGSPVAVFKFKDSRCVLNVNDLPAQSEGLKSDRSRYTSLTTGWRIQVTRYVTGAPVPCGSDVTGVGRVAVRAYATSSVTGDFDFHMHEEVDASKSIGPDQHGDPTTHRYWEMGVDHVHMTAGVERVVINATAQTLAGGLPNGANVTFHFMQQHATDQPVNELFCTFHTTPSIGTGNG
jgi:hypothetical protein